MIRETNRKRKWIGKAVLCTAVLLAAFFGTRIWMDSLPAQDEAAKRVTRSAEADTSEPGTAEPASVEAFSEQEDPEAAESSPYTETASFGTGYLLANLSEDLRTDFAELYRTASNFENFCYLPIPVSRSDTELLMTLLHTECPELFQNDSSQNYHMETVDDFVQTVTIPYCMGKKQYDEELAQCREVIAQITASAGQYSSDYDRALAVYRELCSSCTYDQEGSRAGDAAGVLLGGSGKCDGISLAYKWILDEMGIPCIVVAGKSRTEGREGHAWNVVKTGDFWCAVDVTQDCDAENRSICCYPVFNTSDEILLEEYCLQDGFEKLGVPQCASAEASWHVKNGSYIRSGEEREGFYKAMTRAAEEGGMTAVQFETAEGWKKFEDNSGKWAQDWLDANGVYGASSYVAIDTFRTAQITVSLNENSGRMREISEILSSYEADIGTLKDKLDELKKGIDDKVSQIEDIQNEAEEMLKTDPEEWSEEKHADYSLLSETHGELQEEYRKAAEEYNRKAQEYKELCDVYNALVQEYNALSGKM